MKKIATPMRFLVLTFAVLVFSASLYAERRISFGVIGGIPLTPSFDNDNFTPNPTLPYLGSLYGVHSYSSSNEYAIGPSVEFRLPMDFSIEADGIFHPLNLTRQDYIIGPGPESPISTNYLSWEIATLAKYTVTRPLLKPFAEAGPSFRTVANPLTTSLAKAGITADVGIELSVWHLSITPQVRLTHWRKDSGAAVLNYVASERNQGEFLVGISF
jgi:hypothetical protein